MHPGHDAWAVGNEPNALIELADVVKRHDLRVVSWNMRRAQADSAAWEYFRELSPDVAALQEVGGVPEDLADEYAIQTAVPVTRQGKPQRFRTLVLARGRLSGPLLFRSSIPWVDALLDHFAGNILACEIFCHNAETFRLVNVHSPAWPIPRALYSGADVRGVKLEQNPDLWVTDLVTAALANGATRGTQPWLIIGDFNSCVSFDLGPAGPRGNQEWLDRMTALGLTECLATHHGGMVPTFKVRRRDEPSCQIDKIFATADLVARLDSCTIGDASRVFGQGLSDHLPVVATFHTGAR
jgi:endonuclease/exonuclease/phosphatase family metal-dependent hydrolase